MVEKKAGPQKPWMLELKDFINPHPFHPKFDYTCQREPCSEALAMSVCSGAWGKGVAAISLLPPSPQQYLWGDF